MNSFWILLNNLLCFSFFVSLLFRRFLLGLRNADNHIFHDILNHFLDSFNLVIVFSGLLPGALGLLGVSHLHLGSKVTGDLLNQLLEGTGFKTHSSQQEILDKLVLLHNLLRLPLNLLLQSLDLLGLDIDLTFQGVLQSSQLIL